MRRRRRLRAARRDLSKAMPERWSFGRERTAWRRGLDAVEFRDETALIDQFALLEHYYSDPADVAAEAVTVRSEPNKDERWWSFVMRGEATFARRFIAPQERVIRRLLDHQRAFLDHARLRAAKRRKRKGAWPRIVSALVFLPLLLMRGFVKLQALVFLSAVKGQAALTKSSVNLPLQVKTGYAATREELRTGESRRKFRLAFLNERLWTPERRSAVLFVIVLVAALAYLLSEFLIQAAAPSALPAKRTGDVVMMYSMATRLFLPTPFEPILITGFRELGLFGAVLYTAAGATLGTYVLFLLGSQVNQGLHIFSKNHPKIGRVLLWLEDRGRRYAYAILGVVLAIPFTPDSLAIVGALLRLRLGLFLLTVFLSTVVRSTVFLVVVQGF